MKTAANPKRQAWAKLIFQGDDGSSMGDPFTQIVKSASSSISPLFDKAVLEKYKPDDRHFMLHVIAMGDQEAFGYNRNGDAFPAEMLKKRAGTFVTHGKMYREHHNRDPKYAIGNIKAAAYCPIRHRVEALLHADKDLAAEEYEMAKAGKELAFSMSVKIDYDVCSCCGKKSSHQQFYCEHLKKHMCKYLPQFEKYAFAINPNGTFFDLSRVRRPADRIAYYIKYVFPGEKAASVSERVKSGSDLAEEFGVELPPCGIASLSPPLANVLLEDTDIKNMILSGGPILEQAVIAAKERPVEQSLIDALREAPVGSLMRIFANRGITMPFLPFLSYATGEPMAVIEDKPSFSEAITLLHDLSQCDCNEESANLFYPSSDQKDIVDEIIDKADEAFATSEYGALASPGKKMDISITIIKSSSGSVSEEASAMAGAYASYKAASLAAMPKHKRQYAAFASAAKDLALASKKIKTTLLNFKSLLN